MLLAYIDEIGETGAFVSRTDRRFNTSPAFGYGGFIIPAANSRRFGSEFTIEKRRRFAHEFEDAHDQGRWEVKGSDVFQVHTASRRPENIRIFTSLVTRLRSLGGHLFYYADEKPIGTPKQTNLDKDERQRDAMRETLNRIARHADNRNQEVLVIFDAVNEKERAAHVGNSYAHIFARSSDFPEMGLLVEPPMHVDSRLSSNVQFADWVAAFVGRCIDWQLISDSRYEWVSQHVGLERIHGSFTYESKLHLLGHREVRDFHHSHIMSKSRPLFSFDNATTIGSRLSIERFYRIKNAADRASGDGA